ncbi:hypothetical protein [Streptomyces sp. ISL-94]|uniref:hypothetical protein n=1 Tax=Streptomyces sp. ISL-94 TaxID=2819190 RepID=UPI001BEBF114|nr:hypothetical protein [Streptomyces sp. ISL-94]MBT2477627.1 hypothetical protein [Streptomyces sp. ISL-94]
MTAVPPLPVEAPAPLEGVVVPTEKPAAEGVLARAIDHAAEHRLYAPLASRGYRRLAARWLDRYHDDYPHMIGTARQAIAATDDVGEQQALKAVVTELRANSRRHRIIHSTKTGMWATTAATATTAGTLSGGLWVTALTALGAYLYGIRHGVGDEPRHPTIALPAQFLEQAISQANRAADEPELRGALAQLGFPNITIVANPPANPDGTRTITFDLGGTGTVTDLRKRTEGLAAALGRDVTMVDIDKVPGLAGRASLWTADSDPFQAARPSPLLLQHGPIDSWKDGIPVAFGKRGNTIKLPLMNQNTLVGGMSRSGKGVGASNLIVGATMDPWVNLRIVAGKHNGEWDPYARAGVASTYFKPSPERLLVLLQGLLADKDRRERGLGKQGKSKLIHGLIGAIGGIELLVIDELATYTRPGKPLRDEILSALEELSAVALGAGILMVLITQYPEVDVLPQGLAMNCGTKWAMRVDNATQSNAILGAGSAGAGRDASKFDPPRPGLGWLVNPFADVTDLARSFDLDEDERGEIGLLLQRAVEVRRAAGRLVGQWDDPIEKYLLNATNLSSAAGGPKSDGVPGRSVANLTIEQRVQRDALRGALMAMDQLGRSEAQLDEMAPLIGETLTPEGLGALLRAGGAGGTVKVTVPHKEGRVNGYRRADLEDALKFLDGA